MNCVRFAGILADFHEGKLSAGEKQDADEHLNGCPACRKLLEVALGNKDTLPEEMRDGLAGSILERTIGGPVCPRVESSLWEFVKGEQTWEESHLIALHLDHCNGCRSMAADLALIQEALPDMAELDPGELFTREVVQITCGLRVEQPHMRIRFRIWWNRMVQRPRFALESAYVCTVLLLFALSPFLPFRDFVLQTIPDRAISPSAKYVASVWVDAQGPLAHQAQKLASTAASGSYAAAGTLQEFAARSKRASFSVLDEGRQHIGVWPRKGAAGFEAFWNRLSGVVPRSRS